MEEAHYDTPWEFKTRNFAALHQRPHSTSSPNGYTPEITISPNHTFKNHSITITNGRNSENSNSSNSPPRSISNHRLVQVLHSPTMDSTPRQPLANMKRTHFPVVTASTSSANSTPLVEHRRRRSDKMEGSRKTVNLASHDSSRHVNYPHVRNHSYGLEFEPVQDDKTRNMMSHKSRHKYDEANIVHDGVDRVEAEKLLQSLEIGDFLLRRRPEGNLALSLKASDGVLHIKLEERECRWVLGEGPSFSSISSCIRYYRKTELPIRGAEHILLRYPIMTPVKIN